MATWGSKTFKPQRGQRGEVDKSEGKNGDEGGAGDVRYPWAPYWPLKWRCSVTVNPCPRKTEWMEVHNKGTTRTKGLPYIDSACFVPSIFSFVTPNTLHLS